MKSLLVYFTLLLDQPIPEGLKDLLASKPNFSYKQKADCHEAPNETIYHSDAENNEEKQFMKKGTQNSNQEHDHEPTKAKIFCYDTDEEQKEHNLWNHSEKLALAFALLNTPKGSKIKVFKNLRVCGDCHSVYKYVSLAVHREIVLRDPYRFHHFREGKCSCLDYW